MTATSINHRHHHHLGDCRDKQLKCRILKFEGLSSVPGINFQGSLMSKIQEKYGKWKIMTGESEILRLVRRVLLYRIILFYICNKVSKARILSLLIFTFLLFLLLLLLLLLLLFRFVFLRF